MDKIKNIEFLRIIGCIAIILFHVFNTKIFANPNVPIYWHLKTYMICNSVKAVDLFFIISGCFFALTFNTNIGFWDFIKKKIIRLYPVLIFVIVLYFILSLFHFCKFDFYSNILCLLFLNGTILTLKQGNVIVFWYVSAMFWTLLFYFYLLKNYEKKNINLFAIIAVFFSYGFIIHSRNGGINDHLYTVYNIFNIATLRALGGISLGYLIGNWYKNNIEQIKNYIPTFKQKIFISFFEFLCLFFIINNLLFHKIKYQNDIIFIIAFGGIIFLFLLRKGFISAFLNKDIFARLAVYTYSLYMTHPVIRLILIKTLWKNQTFLYSHPYINILIVIFAVAIFGIITYHLVEKPCAKWLKNKYCK